MACRWNIHTYIHTYIKQFINNKSYKSRHHNINIKRHPFCNRTIFPNKTSSRQLYDYQKQYNIINNIVHVVQHGRGRQNWVDMMVKGHSWFFLNVCVCVRVCVCVCVCSVDDFKKKGASSKLDRWIDLKKISVARYKKFTVLSHYTKIFTRWIYLYVKPFKAGKTEGWRFFLGTKKVHVYGPGNEAKW